MLPGLASAGVRRNKWSSANHGAASNIAAGAYAQLHGYWWIAVWKLTRTNGALVCVEGDISVSVLTLWGKAIPMAVCYRVALSWCTVDAARTFHPHTEETQKPDVMNEAETEPHQIRPTELKANDFYLKFD